MMTLTNIAENPFKGIHAGNSTGAKPSRLSKPRSQIADITVWARLRTGALCERFEARSKK